MEFEVVLKRGPLSVSRHSTHVGAMSGQNRSPTPLANNCKQTIGKWRARLRQT